MSKRPQSNSTRIQTYSAFFDFYLGEHSHPLTRGLHYLGSSLAMASVIWATVSGNGWFYLMAPLSGYACAWIGHFFIENNKPATFTYPLWSLIGDYHMFGLWFTGRLSKRRALATERLS
jgi:hypothetical protein